MPQTISVHTSPQPITPSLHIRGRWLIGSHELTRGDLIEFADIDRVLLGRIEHDGRRYIVVASGRRVPLGEIAQAQYRGSGWVE